MNDAELNDALKRATIPERETGYWEQFPSCVTAEIERRGHAARAETCPVVPTPTVTGLGSPWSWASVFRSLGAKPALAVGLAALCLAVGFALGLWRGHRPAGDGMQLAEARKYFHEIEALFPNQLQAIIFDDRGTHLVLAQKPNLPVSPPLYLKICGPNGCQRVITFSGQQVHVNGEVCDVLTDSQGNVLVVGRQLVWSGAQAASRSGQYQIEARMLETNS